MTLTRLEVSPFHLRINASNAAAEYTQQDRSLVLTNAPRFVNLPATKLLNHVKKMSLAKQICGADIKITLWLVYKVQPLLVESVGF